MKSIKEKFYGLFKKPTAPITQPTDLALLSHSLFKTQVLVELINGYLENKDHKLAQDFKQAEDSFRPKTKEGRLLKYIKEADLKQIDAMYREEKSNLWNIMRKSVVHSLPDGKTEVITPLRYTAKILDTYSRSQLLSYIPHDEIETFWRHVDEQTEFIDLEPLFNAYANQISLNESWFIDEVPDTTVDGHWRTAHGSRMKELAMNARHFLIDMCHQQLDWGNTRKFFYPAIETHYEIWHPIENELLPISAILNELGNSCSLLRGERRSAVAVRNGKNFDDNIADDYEALQQLLEIRKKELATKKCLAPQIFASIQTTPVRRP